MTSNTWNALKWILKVCCMQLVCHLSNNKENNLRVTDILPQLRSSFLSALSVALFFSPHWSNPWRCRYFMRHEGCLKKTFRPMADFREWKSSSSSIPSPSAPLCCLFQSLWLNWKPFVGSRCCIQYVHLWAKDA